MLTVLIHLIVLEEIVIRGVPRPVNLVGQFGVEDDLLVGSGSLHIIIRCNVGVRGTDVVLYANAGDDRTLDHRGEILRVEIAQEGIHLAVGHRALVILGHRGGPVADLEVVGEVAHEGNSGGNSLEGATTQCGGSIGEGTALTLALGKQVVHVAGRARGHEVDGAHTIHIGAAIVVGVFVAEVKGKPVTVGIGEVTVDTVITVFGWTVIDALPTRREVELCVVAGAACGAVRCAALATGTVARVIAQIVHDDGMLLAVLWFAVVATHGDSIARQTVGYGLELYQIDLASRGALGGNLRQHRLVGSLNVCQLPLGCLPEAVEVVLLVGGRDDAGRIDTNHKDIVRHLVVHGSIDAIEARGHIRERHVDRLRSASSHRRAGACRLIESIGIGIEIDHGIGCDGLVVVVLYIYLNSRICSIVLPVSVLCNRHRERQRLQCRGVDDVNSCQRIAATTDDAAVGLQGSEHLTRNGVLLVEAADGHIADTRHRYPA